MSLEISEIAARHIKTLCQQKQKLQGGLKVGDLILSIEGTKIVDSGELVDTVQKNEGKTVDLEVVRDKRTMHVKAVLPKIDEPEDEPTGPRASVWRVPALAPTPFAPPVPPVEVAAPPAPPAPPSPPAARPARPARPAPPAPPAPPCIACDMV